MLRVGGVHRSWHKWTGRVADVLRARTAVHRRRRGFIPPPGPPLPPSPDQSDCRGKKRNFQEGKSCWAIFGTQKFGSQSWRWSGEPRQEVGSQPQQLAHPTTPATSHFPAQHPSSPTPQPTAPTAPPNTHHGVEPPAPTQQRTTPTTTHTHAWLRGRNMRSKGTKERVGCSCCARQRKDLARELGGERLLCAPVGETTPQVDIPGPTSRRWGEVPHRRLGMAACTHLANGEGICLPLRGLNAEK